jgi:hypothetical protein
VRTTIVRFADTETYPRHGDIAGTPAEGLECKGRWKDWRGKPILVFLPPESPNARWHCGTTHVWRVCPETLSELGLPELGFYVCMHQIQAD